MKLEEVILRDDRASQPAANAVAAGTLYYVTDEAVIERSDGASWEEFSNPAVLSDGDKGDIVVSGSGATWTIDNLAVTSGKLAANAVTDAKLRQGAALTVIGRSANSTGDVADIAAGSDGHVLRRSGTTLGFGTIATAGIADDAVTLDKIADQADQTVLANVSGGSASPSAVTRSTIGAVALISEVVTSSSAADVTFSSIPTTFRDLQIRIRGRGTTAATAVAMLMQFNADTGNNYDWQYVRGTTTLAQAAGSVAQSSITIGNLTAASATASLASALCVDVFDYRGTTFHKAAHSANGLKSNQASASDLFTILTAGYWRSTSAINAVKVFPTAGAFVDNTVVSLYGVF
jgi:hypothetical protein